jgi:hypothetical protein
MNIKNTNTKSMQPENKNTNYDEYDKVLEFNYLRSFFTYDKDCGKVVRARLTGGNQSY